MKKSIIEKEAIDALLPKVEQLHDIVRWECEQRIEAYRQKKRKEKSEDGIAKTEMLRATFGLKAQLNSAQGNALGIC